LFEPPTSDSSGNSFMEEQTAGGIGALGASGENVYFQSSGPSPVPETSSIILLGAVNRRGYLQTPAQSTKRATQRRVRNDLDLDTPAPVRHLRTRGE
jgi:hypothetical protein